MSILVIANFTFPQFRYFKSPSSQLFSQFRFWQGRSFTLTCFIDVVSCMLESQLNRVWYYLLIKLYELELWL